MPKTRLFARSTAAKACIALLLISFVACLLGCSDSRITLEDLEAAAQSIGATIGFGTKSPVITADSLDYNGNGITVSNDVWAQIQEHDPELKSPTPKHPITADSLKPIVEKYKAEGRDFNMGMVFPVSTHNYEIRYWLAAAGIHPGMYSDQDINGCD